MHTKRNSLVMTIAVFLAFLALGVSFPHAAKAGGDAAVTACGGDDDNDAAPTQPSNAMVDENGQSVCGLWPEYCADGGIPPAAGPDIGGFNDGSGTISDCDFTNSYTNAVSNIVSHRQFIKHKLMSNIKTLDAKLQYCFDALKATFKTLNVTKSTSIWNAVWSAALGAIIQALVGIVCGLINTIIADFKTMLSAVNNLMCLPIPKLKLPRFKFPALPVASHCNGVSLFKITTNAPTSGKNQPKVLWKIWGKDQQQ